MLPSEYIKINSLAILSSNCLNLIDKLYLDVPSISQISYVLATVRHETAGTYLPIAEYGKGEGKPYGNPDPLTGKIYYGRGYVQLTWKENYERFSRIL